MDILIFTCERREHLLALTWQSFQRCFVRGDHRVILAIDGIVNENIINVVAPDLVIHRRERRGYISSIISATSLVETETFFWLEDDWRLCQAFDPVETAARLLENPQWLQVRLSKTAPLEAADRPLATGINFSSVGFSANPSVCRTALITEAFRHVRKAPSGNMLGRDGFEDVIGRWLEPRGLICAVLDPGDTPAVEHLGDLEATGRAWHMTASLKAAPQGNDFIGKAPPRWRRFWMLAKLARAFGRVGLRQFFIVSDYYLAFRIVSTTTRRNRH